MKLKPGMTVLVSTVFVVAGIVLTMATGLWQTESDKTPRRLETAVENAQPSADGGVTYDPADIRGSYTFGEISNLYGVPLNDLAQAFGVSEADAEAFQTKGVEANFPDAAEEIGTASVRMFVACYLGLPYTPSEAAWLPAAAAETLNKSGHMTEDQAVYLAAHTLP